MTALLPTSGLIRPRNSINTPRSGEQTQTLTRRLPVGAELIAPGRTHFRVWAPRRQRVTLIVEAPEIQEVELKAEGNGYFSSAAEVEAAARYRFRLDEDSILYPDPASRFQPEGPHGPSEVVDPSAFAWTDADWKGAGPEGRVIYEMHIGTFTPEGIWSAATEQLPRLADLGVNLLEVMPVAEFPGRFGWGYDGVDLFAPSHLYGRPDDFRAFVDRAHALGMGVILDVVYNHLGPDGNYLKAFSTAYFSEEHTTDWGDAINFDGADSEPVRDFFLGNAAYWIDEYHLDGLRLDATQNIYDDSPGEHILAGIARVTREAAGSRSIVLVAENEPQHTRLVRPAGRGGYGLDMLWNDDFHHSARVALTGRCEAYYCDHRGHAQEFLSAVKYGYLYQGQYYRWQKQCRGTPAFDLPPWHFVTFLDNHDQVANSGRGLRVQALTSPGRYRAMTALMLLAPATPMLFQGQEFASSAPFCYFADHKPDLTATVRDGRVEFLAQFPSLANPRERPAMPDPHAPETFQRCKLDLAEAERHRWAVELHRDLLRLRREDPTFRKQRPRGVDGAVLGLEALVLRFFGDKPSLDRLLMVNLGLDLDCSPMPEPLLAPPAGCRWEVLWSSEDPRYMGGGIPSLHLEENWLLPGHSAFALRPSAMTDDG
jgi:maltooligosyltrehalose trehalohydrolase